MDPNRQDRCSSRQAAGQTAPSGVAERTDAGNGPSLVTLVCVSGPDRTAERARSLLEEAR